MGKRADDKLRVIAKRRAAKRAAMLKPGAKSKYARKLAQQANGKFSPRSPFEWVPANG